MKPRPTQFPVWLAVALTAFALRLLYVWSVRDSPFFHNLQTNPERYDEWATLILAGHAPAPPFEQAPGYAYFVAAIYALFGRGPEALAMVQSLLDAATSILIGRAAGRWFNSRSGWIAALLAASYGPLIYFSAELLPASVFVFLVSAAITLQLETFWIAAGCAWGFATLVRPEALFAFPIVVTSAGLGGGRRAALASALPITLTVLLCVGVNSAAALKLAPVATSGGLNLWLGNNAHSDGVNPFVHGPLQQVATRVVEDSHNDRVIADRLFRAVALQFWREMPSSALSLTWKKLRWTFAARELPNTADISWQTSYSWLFAVPGLPLSFGLVLPLAFAGLPSLLRRRLSADALLLTAWIVPGLTACVVFFTNARFRLVMTPALVILAAAAIDHFADLLPKWRRRPGALVGCVFLAAIGAYLAWSDAYGIRQYRIPEIDVNTGILEREAGHFPAAIEYLRRGLAAYPDDAIAWVHLALALEQNGQATDALQAYLEASRQLPDDRTVLPMAERFFERHQLDRGQLQTFQRTTSPQLRDAIAKSLAQMVK
ncbi:MAG: glycosyltransferase family 39 protein [Deltaproteobacteria bacterium]|nr:glycosyltransferase family 39 protein [Deltaproteobacteria bacterium]